MLYFLILQCNHIHTIFLALIAVTLLTGATQRSAVADKTPTPAPKPPIVVVVGDVVLGPPLPPKPVQRPKTTVKRTDRVLWVEQRKVGSGQCVAFVQAAGFNIHVGAARNWVTGAAAAGYKTGKTPIKGAAVVTSESSYGSNSGHVALVEKVEDGWVYVVEQNYVRAKVSHGRIPIGSPLVRLYIYPKGTTI